MGEHTKTPWQLAGEPDDMIVCDAEGGSIADCAPPGPWMRQRTAEANAAFIVKAATQYDAHEAVALVALELVTECAGDIPPSLGVLEKLCTALNDLAKAKAASTPDLHGEGG